MGTERERKYSALEHTKLHHSHQKSLQQPNPDSVVDTTNAVGKSVPDLSSDFASSSYRITSAILPLPESMVDRIPGGGVGLNSSTTWPGTQADRPDDVEVSTETYSPGRHIGWDKAAQLGANEDSSRCSSEPSDFEESGGVSLQSDDVSPECEKSDPWVGEALLQAIEHSHITESPSPSACTRADKQRDAPYEVPPRQAHHPVPQVLGVALHLLARDSEAPPPPRMGNFSMNASAREFRPLELSRSVQSCNGNRFWRVDKIRRSVDDRSKTAKAAQSKAAASAKVLKAAKGRKVTIPADKNVKPPPKIPSTSKASTSDPPAPPLAVPRPTKAYLLQATLPSRALTTPQTLLIVMDLNGTLVYRPNRHSTRVVPRPYLPQFLAHILSTSVVMVWSSARPQNVDRMCSQVFTPQQRGQLVARWARDKLGLTQAQYDAKLQVYKRLAPVWNDAAIASKHPGARFGARWGQHDTVLLDDSVLKASSEPYNCLVVPEFAIKVSSRGEGDGGGEDGGSAPVLKQVAGYLSCLAHQADVSAYMRTTPFAVGKGWENFLGGA